VLAVAVIASLLAAIFWWQSRASLTRLTEQNRALEDRNQVLGDELSATRARVDAFDEQIAGLEGELESNATRVTALGADVTALPPEIRELERRIETLQGGRLDARAIWLKEQAEYYLVLANTELTLGRRVGTAIDALELADDVLRDLGDPDLARVRSAISAELQALRAVDQPDLERLTGDLSGLEGRAASLPMRTQTPENFVVVDESRDDEAEPGLGRLWSATKGAMRSIVRVERQEEPVDQLLT
jgi:uroporphyrin-3 C-methyltransferase